MQVKEGYANLSKRPSGRPVRGGVGVGKSRDGGGYSESGAVSKSGQVIPNVATHFPAKSVDWSKIWPANYGMAARYVKGCRSDQCKQANADYSRELRRRRAEAVGDLTDIATPKVSVIGSFHKRPSTSANGAAAPAGIAANSANSVLQAVTTELTL